MIEKIKGNKLLSFLFDAIATSIAGIIIWPLLDYFLFNSIDNIQFTYSVTEHVIAPIIFGFIFAGLSTLVFMRKNQ